jgi:hypothetical protein
MGRAGLEGLRGVSASFWDSMQTEPAPESVGARLRGGVASCCVYICDVVCTVDVSSHEIRQTRFDLIFWGIFRGAIWGICPGNGRTKRTLPSTLAPRPLPRPSWRMTRSAEDRTRPQRGASTAAIPAPAPSYNKMLRRGAPFTGALACIILLVAAGGRHVAPPVRAPGRVSWRAGTLAPFGTLARRDATLIRRTTRIARADLRARPPGGRLPASSCTTPSCRRDQQHAQPASTHQQHAQPRRVHAYSQRAPAASGFRMLHGA